MHTLHNSSRAAAHYLVFCWFEGPQVNNVATLPSSHSTVPVKLKLLNFFLSSFIHMQQAQDELKADDEFQAVE
jgi:hypothetical protein